MVIPGTSPERYDVAVVRWQQDDDMSSAISFELSGLGHRPTQFRAGTAIPEDVDVVLSFGPYGKLFPLCRQMQGIPAHRRPVVAHWNTEGFPDLRIPIWLMGLLARGRSQLGRLEYSSDPRLSGLARSWLLRWLDNHAHRFRYVGDYAYLSSKGWVDVLADSSAVYVQLHRRLGVPAIYAPWGGSASWGADMNLARDIDVLWMGKRATRRRSRLLDRVLEDLRSYGVQCYVADNVEQPFIFGEARTKLLNRVKIVLNLTRTWYDDNFSRLALAAPNRAMMVSEPLLPHCPSFKAGVHYVAGPAEKLAETIAYYLRHESARTSIADEAYRLVTTELTFGMSMQRIMDAVAQRKKQRIPLHR